MSLLKHAMQLALHARLQWTARALTERKDSHRTAERESLALHDANISECNLCRLAFSQYLATSSYVEYIPRLRC